MKNKAAEPKMKVYQAKKKEGDFSLYSNLNPNAKPETQTVSKKKLIRGILHGTDLRTGRVAVGNPITTLDANINLHLSSLKKQGVNQDIITQVKLQTR